MAYDFSQFKARLKEIEERFARELGLIRTGRATTAILDSARVESYGARVPLNHVAGISIEDAKSIRITPWDKSQIKDIERGIAAEDLGISVASDDEGLRVVFPDLTADRRETLAKLARGKLEEARIALRQAREETWADIQEREKSGTLSKDEKFKGKDEMQKLVDASGKKLQEMCEKKEEEISS